MNSMKSRGSPRRATDTKKGGRFHEKLQNKNDRRKEEKTQDVNKKRSDNTRLESAMLNVSSDQVKSGKRKRQPSRKLKEEEEENDRKRRNSKSFHGDKDQNTTTTTTTTSSVGKRQPPNRRKKKGPGRLDTEHYVDTSSEKSSLGLSGGKSISSKLSKQVEKPSSGSQSKKRANAGNGEVSQPVFDNLNLLLEAFEFDSNHPSPEKPAPEVKKPPKDSRVAKNSQTPTRRRPKKSSVEMLPESTFLDDGLKTKVKDTLIPSTLVAESKKVSKAEGASAKSGTSSRNAFNNGKAHAIEKKKRVGKPAAKTSDPQSKLVTAPLRKTEIPVSKEKATKTSVKAMIYTHQRRSFVRSSHIKGGDFRILLDESSNPVSSITPELQLKLAKQSEPLAKMLVHWLSHKRARFWSRHEWIYSDCDRAGSLSSRDFSQLARRIGIVDGVKLTRFEWSLIRQRLGKQRRYVPKFLAGEREKLHQERTRYRQKHEQVKLRRNSVHQHSNSQNHVEPEGTTQNNCTNNNTAGTTMTDLEATTVGNRMIVGDRVQAIHPGDRELMLGKVLTVGRDNFLVQFDRIDHGAHPVTDTDVFRVASYPSVKDSVFHEIFPRAEIENGSQLRSPNGLGLGFQALPGAAGERNRNIVGPQIVHSLTGTSNLLANGIQGWNGPMSVDANAAIYVTAAEAAAFASKAPPEVDALLQLESTLQEKEHLVQNLRELNEDAEDIVKSSGDKLPQFSERFLFHYDTKVHQLLDVNARQDQILHYIRSSSRVSPYGPTQQQQLAAAARFHAQSFVSRVAPVQPASDGGLAYDANPIPGGSQQSVTACETKERLESGGLQALDWDMNSGDASVDEKVLGASSLQSKSSQSTNHGASMASISTPASHSVDRADSEAFQQRVHAVGHALPMPYVTSSAEAVAKANTVLNKSINIAKEQSSGTTDKEERQLLHGLVKSCATTLLLLSACCGQQEKQMKSACVALALRASKPSHLSNTEAFSKVSACAEKLSNEI